MRLCDTCKTVQKTCCQEGVKISLTQGDVQRIKAACGRDNFLELKACPPPVGKDFLDYAYDPNWLHYIILPGYFNRLLKMNPDGNCVFLSENGCVLSEDTRPLICRLYPFGYNEYGLIGLILEDDFWCPIRLLELGENLIENLQITWEQAEQWRDMLYRELRAEYAERDPKEKEELFYP
jgi:Fe-S-cluster containining protein